MNKEIKIFENEEFGQMRTMLIDNEPWFVGKDIAEILGYAKPQNAIATHVDDEDKTTPLIQGTGSNYKSKSTLINESGLYSLILSSKLPNAKKFKRWVTSEVLPSIRQTGGYIPTTEEDDEESIMAKALLIAQKTLDKKNRDIEKLTKDNKHKTSVITSLTENISLADKRQRISQMIKYGTSNYAERYNLLYKEFNLNYHMDVKRRLKNAQERKEVGKSVKIMDYICNERYLNMTNELFRLCCKIFESEWESILNDMKNKIER